MDVGMLNGPEENATGQEHMKEIGTRPWDSQYEIKDTTIIAETPEPRNAPSDVSAMIITTLGRVLATVWLRSSRPTCWRG